MKKKRKWMMAGEYNGIEPNADHIISGALTV